MHSPEPSDREQGGEEFWALAHEDCHPIAFADPQTRQSGSGIRAGCLRRRDGELGRGGGGIWAASRYPSASSGRYL
jgi:hypothetical protein